MIGSSKLKKGFRRRWNHPDRVAGWVNPGLNIEFNDPACRAAVLEAAGLRDIQRVPMDKVIAARMSLCKRQPSLEVFRNNPFILVGRKEP